MRTVYFVYSHHPADHAESFNSVHCSEFSAHAHIQLEKEDSDNDRTEYWLEEGVLYDSGFLSAVRALFRRGGRHGPK